MTGYNPQLPAEIPAIDNIKGFYLKPSQDATAAGNLIFYAADGIAHDSTGASFINVQSGNALGDAELSGHLRSIQWTKIDLSTKGLNGLDASTSIVPDELLYVYAIAAASGPQVRAQHQNQYYDPATGDIKATTVDEGQNGLPSGFIVSRNHEGFSDLSLKRPIMPAGYNLYRYVGSVLINAAGDAIVKFTQNGAGKDRLVCYAAPVVVKTVANGDLLAVAPTALVLVDAFNAPTYAASPISFYNKIPVTAKTAKLGIVATITANTKTLRYYFKALYSTSVVGQVVASLTSTGAANERAALTIDVPVGLNASDEQAPLTLFAIGGDTNSNVSHIKLLGYVDSL